MQSLKDIFPDFSDGQLRDALDLARGELDTAAAILLKPKLATVSQLTTRERQDVPINPIKSRGWHLVVNSSQIGPRNLVASQKLLNGLKESANGLTETDFPDLSSKKTTGLGNATELRKVESRWPKKRNIVQPLLASNRNTERTVGPSVNDEQLLSDADTNDPKTVETMVNSLMEEFPGGDRSFVRDIFLGIGGGVELAEECIRGMGLSGGGQIESSSTSLNHVKQISNLPENANTPAEVDQGDLLQSYRKVALKLSKARDRYSLGAMNAFMNGDHARARELSMAARDSKQRVEQLHKAAAEQIIKEQNRDGGMWELDLHYLNGKEAVEALRLRLEELEAVQLSGKPVKPNFFDSAGSSAGASGMPVARKSHLQLQELMVITGVGNRSREGPVLPRVVETFLVENNYVFHRPRDGVVCVRPKKTSSFKS